MFFVYFVSAPWAPSRVDMYALQIFIIIIIVVIKDTEGVQCIGPRMGIGTH